MPSDVRRRWVRLLVASGAVVVVAGSGLLWWPDDGSPRGGRPPQTQQVGGVTVEHLWTVELSTGEDDDDESEPPAPVAHVDGDTAYVARGTRLRAVDLATGAQRWDVQVAENAISGLDAGDDAIAVRVDDPDDFSATLTVVDADTGRTRWGDVPSHGQPVIAGDVVAAAPDSGSGLVAYDLGTGRPRWDQPQADGHRLCTTDGRRLTTYLPTADGGDDLTLLAPEDGRPLDRPPPAEQRPGAGGSRYLTCSGDGVVAIESGHATVYHGSERLVEWGESVDNVRCCDKESGLAAGDHLVVNTYDNVAGLVHHTLLAYRAPTEVVWRYRTPAIGSGDEVRYRQLRVGADRARLYLVANDTLGLPATQPGSGDQIAPERRRFTRLLDEQGRELGELRDDLDDPSMVETDGGDTFVLGDAEVLVGFRVADDAR